MPNKEFVRKICHKSDFGDKTQNAWRARRDLATLKYLKKAETRKFVLTKRTISEMSPWTKQMIKTILRKDIVDIKSGLAELLERGATLEEVSLAFSVSPIYERLASLNYSKHGNRN